VADSGRGMEEFGIQIITSEPKVSRFLIPKAFLSNELFLQFELQVVFLEMSSSGERGH
jgi:hypothetical protein